MIPDLQPARLPLLVTGVAGVAENCQRPVVGDRDDVVMTERQAVVARAREINGLKAEVRHAGDGTEIEGNARAVDEQSVGPRVAAHKGNIGGVEGDGAS